MKKLLIGILGMFLGAAIAVIVVYFVLQEPKTDGEEKNQNTSTETKKENTSNETKKEEQTETKKDETSSENKNTNTQNNDQKNGYEIILSKKEITVKKGSSESFDITFTNPDESSIREYIHSDNQNDIIVVKYSDMKDKKINVQVEGLKVGTSEISISDYNYPNKKEIVKVKVVE